MQIVRECNHWRSTSYARKRFYSMTHAGKEDVAERNDSKIALVGNIRFATIVRTPAAVT